MPERLYHLTETLIGSCSYEIWASSAREAREKLRRGEHGEMYGYKVDHTGRARVRRINEVAPRERQADGS